MRLSDIMSGAGLALYPQIAMVIFLAVFAIVCVRVWRPSRAERLDRYAALPLDEAPLLGAPVSSKGSDGVIRS